MVKPPCIESLENRKLLASISLSDHLLSVMGTTSQPNTITLGLLPGAASVYATISYPTKTGVVTKTKSFALSRIHQVKIDGGNKSDLITIDQTNGSFLVSTAINTLAGNDTVTGGDGPDKVTCGKGADSVLSGNGNDTLLAGAGPDTLIGGNGNDQLRSGKGHDLLMAGNGANVFTDPYGTCTLQGGTGHDIYVLKSITLDPDNNYSATKDTLKKYVPPTTSNNLLNDILNGLENSGFI